jgi:hypothetical protein
MLPLDASVLQQPVLPLDVCLFYGSLCCTWTCLIYSSRFYFLDVSSAACAALERVSLLHQSVLSIDVSVCMFYSILHCPRRCLGCRSLRFTWTYLFKSSLCCAKRYLAFKSLCCTCTNCLQEPVLHLDVFIYKSFCAAPGRLCLHVLYLDVSA